MISAEEGLHGYGANARVVSQQARRAPRRRTVAFTTVPLGTCGRSISPNGTLPCTLAHVDATGAGPTRDVGR